jgi:hypothetical protein
MIANHSQRSWKAPTSTPPFRHLSPRRFARKWVFKHRLADRGLRLAAGLLPRARPPKPPPVIRAPNAPAASAPCTSPAGTSRPTSAWSASTTWTWRAPPGPRSPRSARTSPRSAASASASCSPRSPIPQRHHNRPDGTDSSRQHRSPSWLTPDAGFDAVVHLAGRFEVAESVAAPNCTGSARLSSRWS